jgi:hypothetical protein
MRDAPALRTIAVAAAGLREGIAGCEQLLEDSVVVALRGDGWEAGREVRREGVGDISWSRVRKECR